VSVSSPMRMWSCDRLRCRPFPLTPGDSYDIFAINIASTMLGYVYGKGAFLKPFLCLGLVRLSSVISRR